MPSSGVLLHVHPRAEVVDLLGRGEEAPHPPAGWHEPLGPGDQVEQDAHRRGIVIGPRAARDRIVMGAQDEDAIARPDLDGVGLALSFAAREGMTAERDAAVLEVAGHGGLTARRVPADQEAGEVPGRVIAREHRVERSGRRQGPGRAAVQQPPDRAQDESEEAKRLVQSP